jgi:hypothetical protein
MHRAARAAPFQYNGHGLFAPSIGTEHRTRIGTVERKLPGGARRWEVTTDRAARAAPFRTPDRACSRRA